MTHILLYDDKCPLCSFQMKLLTWLDWFNLLSMLPLSHPQAAELTKGISRHDLLEAIHCLTREGRIHRGARALRFVGMRLVLAFPMALFLWIPGVIWIAERVYQVISRNRHLLSRVFGCKDACALLPTRERANERDLLGP
jgi:predicted DCC family thiol-disulfide oxidoreductase YuxK